MIGKREIKYVLASWPLWLLYLLAGIVTLVPFFIQALPVCSGLKCEYSLGDMRDGAWFDSIAAISFKTLPFQLPNFSGAPLLGYHYLPNLFAYAVHQLTSVPFAIIRLAVLPVVYFILFSILSINTARKLHDSRLFVFLFSLFMLFGGPLRPLTALINLNMSEMWQSNMINTFDSSNIMASPHTGFSHILVLLILNILLRDKNRLRIKNIVLSFFMTIVLFGVKFYSALAVLIVLLSYVFIEGLRKRSNRTVILTVCISVISLMIAYLMFYQSGHVSTKPPFIFSPFATVHHIIENPGRFFFSQDLTLQRYSLYALNKLSPRLMAIELYSVGVSYLYYLGARIFGLAYLLYCIKKGSRDSLSLSIGIALIVCLVIPALFIQRGTWFDTMQFLVSGGFLLSIFSAQLIYSARRFTCFSQIVLIITTVLVLTQGIFAFRSIIYPYRSTISHEEAVALNRLKSLPVGTVFYPITSHDSPYVNALSEKQSYFNYTHVLDNIGIDYARRATIVQEADIHSIYLDAVEYIYLKTDYGPEMKEYVINLRKKMMDSRLYRLYFKNTKAEVYVRTNTKPT